MMTTREPMWPASWRRGSDGDDELHSTSGASLQPRTYKPMQPRAMEREERLARRPKSIPAWALTPELSRATKWRRLGRIVSPHCGQPALRLRELHERFHTQR